VQQGQSGNYVSFSTPLEYMITPEHGDCSYDERSATTSRGSALAFIEGVLDLYTSSHDPIIFTSETLPAEETTGVRPGNVSGTVAALVGNSEEAKEALSRFHRGLTTTYTEAIKRAYYKAALVTSQLQDDSFTEDFKTAARALAAKPTREAARAFIMAYGDFVLDSAVLGASISRTLYTQGDATPTATRKVKDARGFGYATDLLGSQDLLSSLADIQTEGDKSFRFEMSRVHRIGEFAIGSSLDSDDSCGIGKAILPQVRRLVVVRVVGRGGAWG
jgi:hypothetical protein